MSASYVSPSTSTIWSLDQCPLPGAPQTKISALQSQRKAETFLDNDTHQSKICLTSLHWEPAEESVGRQKGTYVLSAPWQGRRVCEGTYEIGAATVMLGGRTGEDPGGQSLGEPGSDVA